MIITEDRERYYREFLRSILANATPLSGFVILALALSLEMCMDVDRSRVFPYRILDENRSPEVTITCLSVSMCGCMNACSWRKLLHVIELIHKRIFVISATHQDLVRLCRYLRPTLFDWARLIEASPHYLVAIPIEYHSTVYTTIYSKHFNGRHQRHLETIQLEIT